MLTKDKEVVSQNHSLVLWGPVATSQSCFTSELQDSQASHPQPTERLANALFSSICLLFPTLGKKSSKKTQALLVAQMNYNVVETISLYEV